MRKEQYDLAPVHFLSHGTTMLLGEDSRIRDFWTKLGRDALRHDVRGVIIMGAHWNAEGRKVKVAMNPSPTLMPLANTDAKHWANWKPNPDLETGRQVIKMLKMANIEAEEDSQFEWMIDTFPILIAMFGDQCPPTTIISQNSYFDPYFHIQIGTALRTLRGKRYLLIGSGGGTHNLYRAEWKFMLKYKDNFAMEKPPDKDSIEFRQSLEDVICKNGGGPELRRGLARLMKNPYFREAHGTDEHYVSACFVAGAVGDEEDRGANAKLGAEAWELRTQCESQFTIGEWPKAWKKFTT
ncbi:LigB subunit of an aromatic-ring-opening dioxygenase LigAB [Aaosphaeria arxii CBS 175.79]|uniref:LigB subunit of an aromatic-ring-opening dioxygenase LigAB n=1 Tax=Aaosphaeria arxii CBS 175.79 TaxID=1450172 RepID=A0A6A5XMR4_9PLEO|nr:LigB subunit of an aromatic-ring-opening dioxygenase LigAB [Aaosphaeria arxii CBS 175.79]KAF2014101.1 LigB subunit of an aromatic-ring-opening dioxygenase LigAB [Aaosphaeria arxii CBS 175.79]